MNKRLFCFVLLTVVMGIGIHSGWAEERKEIKKAKPFKEISIVLKSGINIAGELFEPRDQKNLSFVLLHGLGSNRHEWRSFAEKLHVLGYGVFSYDARGHGDSTADTDGNEINYKTFPQWGRSTPWKLMVDDLDEILVYLEKLEGLDKTRFVLGGASLGANVVLSCASRKKNIRGLILLSPGLNYAGIETEYPMRFCRVPAIAIAASTGDTYAYESSKKLQSFMRNKKRITFFSSEGSEHGVNMFRRGLDAELLGWIQKKIEHK